MAGGQSITALAEAIVKDTAIVNDYFEKNGLPKPSFDENGPQTIRIPPSNPEVFQAHIRAIAATRELNVLLQGPTSPFRRIYANNDLIYHHVVTHFDIPKHVPAEGDISFEDLSKRCSVDLLNLKRVLRYAMTDWMFKETRPGYVGHTAASRALKDSQSFRDTIGGIGNESFMAGTKVVETIERYPGSQEPNECPWALANHATRPFFEELALRHPERSRAVANAMDTMSANVPLEPLFGLYDFNTLGNGKKATLVDIGGGHGSVSVGLIKNFPNLECIVQDLPQAIEAGEAKRKELSQDIQSRLSFQVHDMFEAQPIKSADAYFYRAVFHDWSDKYGIKMLQALIPALKKGAKVILNDGVMPEIGKLPPPMERLYRVRDMAMMLMFNARERMESDWKDLFEAADSRFKFVGVKRALGSGNIPQYAVPCIIEAVWDP